MGGGAGRGCAGVRRDGSVAGTSPSRAPGRAQPAPPPPSAGGNKGGSARGDKPRGKGAERLAVSRPGIARFVQERGRGGVGATQTREVGGPRARASCGLAVGGGVACARSAGYCAGASGQRAPGRGAAGRGPLVQRCGVVRRPGRLGRGGREDGAPEALADFCQLWACSRRFLARPV